MKNLLSRYISLSLALRYLNPLRTFFSIITLICLLGVSLGVMVLIVVLFSKALTLVYLLMNEDVLVDRQYSQFPTPF